MLYLNSQDIRAAVDRAALIEKMEAAMRLAETGKVLMPPRTYVNQGPNSLGLMPCFSDTAFSTKLVTIFPGNQGGTDPVVNGLVILNDIDSGAPRAILEGRTFTAVRTGAVGAVGVKHFAVPRPHALGLVGAGVQGFEQVLSAATARKFTAVKVFDRNPDVLPDFLARLAPLLPGVSLSQVSHAGELLTDCQTIILSTTSPTPVLPDRPELMEGRCIVGTGSYKPDMQEIPRAAFRAAGRIFLDTVHAAHESGDVITPKTEGWVPRNAIQTMGNFLDGGEDEAPLQETTTVYKSVGMALFDLAAAEYLYKTARAMGLGTTLTP